ncbi:MAG: V-type ATP synthase subunit K, partial [Spirochaetaceae bacterium]|nr:V-type ATP synthase subunit K [Spirochaetaceae bacterium]
MIGYIGAAFVLGIAAIGSAIGIGAAGNAAIGAWKRCYMNNKPAPFILTVFAGAPLTQTIYGFLLMQQLRDKLVAGTIEPAAALILGIFSGIAMAASAIAQGKAGASASDALGETG